MEEAKYQSLDLPRLVSIEYPLIIKNDTNKAIQMIGGKETMLKNFSNLEPLELRLRPGDRYSHPIEGKPVQTDNILMKISISKKLLEEKYNGDLKMYLQAIEEQRRNNEPTMVLKTTPIGIINYTYRFREIADYQYITKNMDFAKTVDRSIFSGDYEQIKKLDLTTDKYPWSAHNKPRKDEDLEIPPPPLFSQVKIPVHYYYQPNDNTTVQTLETGKKKVVSGFKARKLYSTIISFVDYPCPFHPNIKLVDEWQSWTNILLQDLEHRKSEFGITELDHDSIFPDLENLKFDSSEIPEKLWEALLKSVDHGVNYRYLQTIEMLQKIFEIEPITLRARLLHIVPKVLHPYIKVALPFVSYIFRKGPWRTCLVKFGVDPRLENKYRDHQVESFRILGMSAKKIERLQIGEIEEEDEEDEAEEDENLVNDPGVFDFSNRLTFKDPKQVIQDFQFTGEKFPKSLNFFIQDLVDPDVQKVFEKNSSLKLNDKPTESSGWYNYRIMFAIRRIVRYKIPFLFSSKEVPRPRINLFIENSVNNIDEKSQNPEETEAQDLQEAQEALGKDMDDNDDEPELDFHNVEEVIKIWKESGEAKFLETLKKLNPKDKTIFEEIRGIINQENIGI